MTVSVLVTGSSGRVGRELVATLRARGIETVGLDVAATEAGARPDRFVEGGLLDREAVRGALVGVDAVIHLAAQMSWNPADADRVFRANVDGTFVLLDEARKASLRRFVFGSSGEVYPELSPVYQPIDESHPTRPLSTYGMTKLLGEEMVRHWERAHGIPACILRFAHTQEARELLDPQSFFSGPRFFVHAKLRQLRSFPSNPAIDASIAALDVVAGDDEVHYIGCSPDGTPYRMAICDARDLVAGIVLGLEHPAAAGETFNIGPAASVDFDALVPHMASFTGLDVQPVRLQTASYRYDTSIEKAKRLLGYAPRHDPFSMVEEAAAEDDS